MPTNHHLNNMPSLIAAPLDRHLSSSNRPVQAKQGTKQAFRLLLASLALAVLPMNALGAVDREPPKLERLGQTGRWLVDSKKRVVLLHGGNMQLPSDDRTEDVISPETPRLMAANGFNGVRLVIFFSRLMPQPGKIDTAYLEEIGREVAAYREAGVYVLIDFHQDEYGPAVGVRGLPAWATFSDGHEPKKLQFPSGYFSDPAIHAAFDNFWKNHPVPGTDKGVQDFYMEGLAAVAAHFRNEPAVFGIDVMNEPFPGSRGNQPDPVSVNQPELETELLAPFYERAGKAIATAVPATIVFVEPFMLQGSMGVPVATPAPGAPAKRGMSFHQYGGLADIRKRGNAYALASAERTGSAILNTEWGFTNDPAEWIAQAQELDDLLLPWLAWARGPFAPLVDPSLPKQGNDNRESTLRALTRPYPRATAGTPLRLTFAGESGTLTYSYSTTAPNGRLHEGLTEIVMPKANFPAGYTVTIDTHEAAVVSGADAPVLLVRAAPGTGSVTVNAVRKGNLPPLPAIMPTVDPYAFLNQNSATKSAGPLSTRSLLGDLLGDPRARAILDREIPDLVRSPQIGMASQMALRALKPFVPAMLTDEKLDLIDRALAELAPAANNEKR